MRKHLSIALAGATMLAGAAAGTASAAPSAVFGDHGRTGGDVRGLPRFVKKWQAEKKTAADLVARGAAKPGRKGVVKLKNGRYVQHALQSTEHMTVALIDFSDRRHGELAEPDRTTDNSTYWSSDVSPQHYRDMLFAPGGGSYGLPSMHDFYLELSSGRMTWDGQVSDWVPVDGTAADFGANSEERGAGGDDANGPVSRVVKATLDALATSPGHGGIDLGTADQIDRYDCDGDGNFNEPDGYIDHFAIVHAGMGEDGGGDEDSIWSHRSYANPNDEEGPAGCHKGGYQLGNTGLWAGDYTIEAENGGMGVFAHEFGHDLGLPDEYDTTYGSDNNTGFWTLMSSGSWGSFPETPSIGTSPMHMGAWDKQYLGWLDLATANAGDKGTFRLGPAERDTKGDSQALAVDLPTYDRTTQVFPVDGSDADYLYSGKGDDLDNSAVHTLGTPLSAETPVSFRADYDIEKDWDYAYLDAKVGDSWKHVATNVSSAVSPNGQNFGNGITGASNGWTTVTGTLPANTSAYRFRYWTDGATQGKGFAADSVTVGSTTEDMTDVSDWTLKGFRQVADGKYTETLHHYYLAESRSRTLGDRALCGAYLFTTDTWVEKRCYAQGVLIWYRNEGSPDNHTYEHPGENEIMPVDMHPAPMVKPDGKTAWSGRWQTWDSPLSVDRQKITLTQAGVGSKTYTAEPVTTFDDSSTTAYYDARTPYYSVKTAGSGVRLAIVDASKDRSRYTVKLSSSKR
jgi:immune inhibitor A